MKNSQIDLKQIQRLQQQMEQWCDQNSSNFV